MGWGRGVNGVGKVKNWVGMGWGWGGDGVGMGCGWGGDGVWMGWERLGIGWEWGASPAVLVSAIAAKI